MRRIQVDANAVTLTQHLLPNETTTYNIGSPSVQFSRGYINQLYPDLVDITSTLAIPSGAAAPVGARRLVMNTAGANGGRLQIEYPDATDHDLMTLDQNATLPGAITVTGSLAVPASAPAVANRLGFSGALLQWHDGTAARTGLYDITAGTGTTVSGTGATRAVDVTYGSAPSTAAQGSNTWTSRNDGGSFTFSVAPTIGTAASVQSVTPVWGVVGGIKDVDLTASAVGISDTFARIDHGHVLDQGIAPVWTGAHQFDSLAITATAGAPSGVRQVKIDTDTGRIVYKRPDSGNRSVANLEDANTWAAAQTHSVAPIFSPITAGSVIFSSGSGTVTQDNANFFWDDAGNNLGIGTTTPRLETSGTTAGNPCFTAYHATGNGGIELASGTSTNTAVVGRLAFVANQNDASSKLISFIDTQLIGSSGTVRGGQMRIWTKPDGGAGAVAALINSDGVFISNRGHRFTATAALTDNTAGNTWHDSTQKALTMFANGITQTFSTVTYSKTADTNVSASTTETTLTGTGVGPSTLPASFFMAGKTLRVRARGTLSSTAVPGTFEIRLRMYSSAGYVAILDTGAQTVTGSLVDRSWWLDGDLTCRTTGASGTVMANSGGFQYYSAVTGLTGFDTANRTATTLDTTVVQTPGLTAQWGTSNASNSITCTHLSYEVLQ